MTIGERGDSTANARQNSWARCGICPRYCGPVARRGPNTRQLAKKLRQCAADLEAVAGNRGDTTDHISQRWQRANDRPRLTHRAKIVAELTERLGNAFDGTDEDAGFQGRHNWRQIAKDLESLLRLFREGRICKAMVQPHTGNRYCRRDRIANRLEA